MESPQPVATEQGGSPGAARQQPEPVRARNGWGQLALGIAAIVGEELVRRWLRGRRGGGGGRGHGRS